MELDTNQLLYLRTAECSDPLFYHFKAHSALDVIEDKLSKRTISGSPDQLEQYLGLLYPMEDHRIYGTPIQLNQLPAARRFDQRISTLSATHASSGYCSTFTSLIDAAKKPTGESLTTSIISPKARL
ncbi:unnamed protein product [Trichobilharzia regenti]|nr:unnamed protein product [Trichobilharzia regenti]